MDSMASSATVRATSSLETVLGNSETNSPVSQSKQSVKKPWRSDPVKAAADYKILYPNYPKPEKDNHVAVSLSHKSKNIPFGCLRSQATVSRVSLL